MDPQASVVKEEQITAKTNSVACDFCIGKKKEAVKSCLQCLVSYCKTHLQPHYSSPAFGKHKLVEPCKNLQAEDEQEKEENVICPQHNEIMKMFCCTDQRCICYLCSTGEHKGHDVVSAAAAVAEKQQKLETCRREIQQTTQIRETNLRALSQHMESVNHRVDEVVKHMERIFVEAKQQIRVRQEAEVTRVGRVQEKTQQEVNQLRERDQELEQLQLSNYKDHAQFLHVYNQLCQNKVIDSPGQTQALYSEVMTSLLSEIRGKLLDVTTVEWDIENPQSSCHMNTVEEEPPTRDELLKHSCQLTLDLNSANCKLVQLSNSRKACFHASIHNASVHPDQFTSWGQVLCKESLTGRCYWEVERTGKEVFIAVSYKDIKRTGEESAFGHNKKSWALQCSRDHYEFRHSNIRIPVSGPASTRVGVYLDHQAGILSFYSISQNNMITLLHRVQTVFGRPLCAGLGLQDGCTAQIHNALYKEN